MAAPVLTSLDPTSVDISTGAMVPVTIAGTGFAADDVLMVNGADDLGTFVSDTEFTFSVDTLTASGASTLQIAVRNAAAEVSNELPLELTGETAIGDPDFIPETPEEGASPNTEAIRAEYHAPEPADVYQGHPVQVPPESTVTGVPRAHVPEPEELPTTNAYKNGDGGLPSNPREPYPTGHPRADTWARLQGAR